MALVIVQMMMRIYLMRTVMMRKQTPVMKRMVIIQSRDWGINWCVHLEGRVSYVHYPKPAQFQRTVYTAVKANTIRDIDNAIQSKQYDRACNISFKSLFEPRQSELYSGTHEGGVLNTPFRIPHLEAKLLTKYAAQIKRVSIVTPACTVSSSLRDLKGTNVWLQIVAYAILTNPDFGQDPVSL